MTPGEEKEGSGSVAPPFLSSYISSLNGLDAVCQSCHQSGNVIRIHLPVCFNQVTTFDYGAPDLAPAARPTPTPSQPIQAAQGNRRPQPQARVAAGFQERPPGEIVALSSRQVPLVFLICLEYILTM